MVKKYPNYQKKNGFGFMNDSDSDSGKENADEEKATVKKESNFGRHKVF